MRLRAACYKPMASKKDGEQSMGESEILILVLGFVVVLIGGFRWFFRRK